MKKLFALLLAAIMVISMAACAPAEPAGTTTGKADTTNAPAATTTVAATTTEPKLDLTALPFVEPNSEKITIGIMVNATVLDYHDNAYTKYIEEQTGIDIEFSFFSSDAGEAKTQLSLMMANQEKLPDILLGHLLDKTKVGEMARDGYLVDLTDYFEEYSYWFKWWESSMIDVERDYMWARVKDPSDGGIYYFPAPKLNDTHDSMGWQGGINKVFAKNLGMNVDEIDTVAEVHEFLTRAVKEDGNGNGKNDEIGMAYYDRFRANLEIWIINAYIPCTDNYLYNVTDGELWLPYGTDEYRKALIELNKWYQEGLIFPTSFTNPEHAEMKALVDTPDNYKVAIYGGHPSLMSTQDGTFGLQYRHLNVLQDETGKGGHGQLLDPYACDIAGVLTTSCENPVLAFRLMDWLTNPVAQKYAAYGEEGVNWERIDGEALGLKDKYGNWAGLSVPKSEWSTETKATWHYNPFVANTTNGRTEGPDIDLGYLPDTPPKEGSSASILTPGYAEMKEHKAENYVYSLVYNEEETDINDEYKASYKEYVMNTRREFIAGVLDPNNDADWEKYLKELELNGQAELLEASQAAYDRMFK